MKALLLAAGLFVSLVTGALAHDISLAGSTWVMADGSGRSITFASGGHVSGFAGCNRFFGTYAQSGDNLRIKASGSTRMGCFKSKGGGDSEFLGLLSATRRAAFAEGGLTLLTKGRRVLARFRQK